MALQVDPPLTNKTLDIQQAWHKLIKKLQTEFVDTGWGGILFVDSVDGNDASARRGSLTFKYATIQAALDDAQDGDIVWVGPGTYAETLTWPVDVNQLTLQGVGRATVITSGAGGDTLTVAPTADTVTTLFIRDLYLFNTAGNDCLVIDGTNDLELGNNGVVSLENLGFVTAGNGLNVNICGGMECQGLDSNDADWTLAQTGQILVHNTQIQNLAFDNDPAGTIPTVGFGALIMDSVTADDVTVANLANLAATDDVQFGSITAAIIDTATDNGAINFSGRCLGNVAITFDFDDQADLVPVVLNEARINGDLTFGLAAGGTGGNVVSARARHATFDTTSNITVDSEGTLDLRGALYNQANLASGDTETTGTRGTIDRTEWYIDEASGAGAASSAVSFATLPYPTGTSEYVVVVEGDTIADLPVQIDTKSATAFNRTKTADGGNLRFLVIRPYN